MTLLIVKRAAERLTISAGSVYLLCSSDLFASCSLRFPVSNCHSFGEPL